MYYHLPVLQEIVQEMLDHGDKINMIEVIKVWRLKYPASQQPSNAQLTETFESLELAPTN